MDKRISNLKQVRSAYKLTFTDGTASGKQGVLVNVGELEVFFNSSNALDISWVKYRGVNISFLSKNGLNSNGLSFAQNFEGGFLYTCGMDNVSACVKDKPIHGSLHYKPCQNVRYEETEDGIVVKGYIEDTELFGKNLRLEREFTVTDGQIKICDTVINNGTKEEKYVFLYHTNYGYPFLSEDLVLTIPAKQSDPLTEIATKRKAEMFTITTPIDNNPEDVYYHTMQKGEVKLFNEKLGFGVKMSYSTEDFPVTLEWKSMASGDYALGIEPSLTRFDDFKMRTLKTGERKTYKITVNFGENV